MREPQRHAAVRRTGLVLGAAAVGAACLLADRAPEPPDSLAAAAPLAMPGAPEAGPRTRHRVEQPPSAALPARPLQPACAAVRPVAQPQGDARALDLAWQQLLQALAGGNGTQQTLSLLIAGPDGSDAESRARWAARLVLTAQQSGDALALRWAGPACEALPDAAACRRTLAQARVDAEPANGLHWVELLDASPEAADRAWQGLAAASTWREHPQARLAVADAVQDRRLPEALRAAVLQRVAAGAAATSPHPMTPLETSCSHWGPDHPWGASCAQAARLMLADGDTAAAVHRGLALVRPQDLPEPRRLAAQTRAEQLDAPARSATAPSRAGCSPLPS